MSFLDKELEKKDLIVLVIVLILIGTGIWWSQNQKAINLCKEKCVYITTERRGTLTKPEYVKVDYWRFGEYPKYRKFETQKQCIDYCLSVK